MTSPTILVADDDPAIRVVLEQAIEQRGYQAKLTDNIPTLLDWIDDGLGDAVITDVLMPSGNGLDVLPHITSTRPNLPIIVISAHNTLANAVRANELKAYDYIPKPFDLNLLLDTVEKSLTQRAESESILDGHLSASEITDTLSLIGSSSAMQEVYRVLARLVHNDLTVVVHGESGTGKELVARALHSLGQRKDKPFVAINMGAIPRDLVESELFGHEKGAFTGAAVRKLGKFAEAHGGTLFLDEIGDMPLEAQTKLLRVLQQGEYMAVGSNRATKVDVRIICATHRDLKEQVANGEFREDLYYRLHVVPIQVPPLRERKEDIVSLTHHFLQKAAEKGLPSKEINADALNALQHYGWPGNVRELENLIYRLCALYSETIITPASVNAELQTEHNAQDSMQSRDANSLQAQVAAHLRAFFAAHTDNTPAPGLYNRVVRLVEKPLIEHTLAATGGNQLKAAKILGINRNTLRKKIQELDITPSECSDALQESA
ncbi:MAG: nitrogen regulation protein NR(I) [Rickettsiales bacterium]|nr:nitrogen regulation protein NR(I) [Rickettsiales bacterium]